MWPGVQVSGQSPPTAAGLASGRRFGDTVAFDAEIPGACQASRDYRAGGPAMAKQAKVVEKLRELTRNLWWTWQPNDLTLFHLLDIELWHETNHNPVEFLARIPPEKLEYRRRGGGPALADRLRVPPALGVSEETTTAGPPCTPRPCGRARSRTSRRSSACTRACPSTPAASASWRATTSRAPATWACRSSASACSTPRGTSSQSLDGDGWQQETYLGHRRRPCSPIEPVIGRRRQAAPASRSTRTPARSTRRSGRSSVGRTTLYLLDSNVPENSESDRDLTSRLYGGDARVRIRQELLLGVGGVAVARRARDVTRRSST